MLRWVWPILFISYVKCACCIPFRRFSAGNHDSFFFSFHFRIAPWFSNVSPQVNFNLLPLSFRLTFVVRIRCFDEDLCESPSQPSHLSTRLPALIMQMTLVTKKVKVKNVLKSKRTTVQITAAAKRWFFSIDLLYCFWCPNESRLIRHYNSVSNLKVFFFSWNLNGKKLTRK